MERMQKEAFWGYIPLVLKNGVLGEKGKLACLDTAANGQIDKGKTGEGLIALGVFAETRTGDGVKTISIKLFQPIHPWWWNNDAGGGAITAADIGTVAYIKDDQTVTAEATGRSSLGLILAVDAAKGVLVYSPLPFLPAPAE